MKNILNMSIWMVALVGCSMLKHETEEKTSVVTKEVSENQTSSLGAFSMSLSVKDLKVSKEFYEKLGYSSFGGDESMNYLIMKNGNSLIGLFQGMFEGNILTFNPGWDENAKDISEFTDIRNIYQDLASQGIQFDKDVEGTPSGPASFMLTDPDGNLILVDQHR
jgi:predicted enzyme related to lactoylglutathione lyase